VTREGEERDITPSEVQWLGILQWKSECTKKKIFKGFPMFFTLKNLKTALMGDIKLWSSRQYRRRRRYRRRHHRGRSNVDKKDEWCQMQLLVMAEAY
jgi:hypothetical protein